MAQKLASYAIDKLYLSVVGLAAGPGNLTERLDSIYNWHLCLVRPGIHIPWPDLQDRFDGLMQELAYGGSGQAVKRSRTEAETRDVCERVVALFQRMVERGEHPAA